MDKTIVNDYNAEFFTYKNVSYLLSKHTLALADNSKKVYWCVLYRLLGVNSPFSKLEEGEVLEWETYHGSNKI